jgi:predicted LPLAT superfamily acyltransferase
VTAVAHAEDQRWRSRGERGSVLGVRFVVFLATVFGRAPARFFVRILAFYFTLFAGPARRGMRSYFERIGERPSFSRAYTQVLRFAHVTLDGLFLLSGKTKGISFDRDGTHHLEELKRSGRGAILLGAHHGSFYAMRGKSGMENIPVYAVVYTKHAQRINRVLDEISPASKARLLSMGEGVDFMLKIRELIEQGALIAILNDRVGSDDRAVEVDFLGAKARFPTGAFILASTLKCPVYLTFGLFRDPDRYELYCEPFAEKIDLPRKERQAALHAYVQRYAERLESYVRKAPDNWFNFYDFWRKTA